MKPLYYLLNSDHTIRSTEDVMLWARDMQTTRRVAEDILGEYRVSTIFMGLDHRFGESGPPLLFETMVFSGNSHDDETQERCSTYVEALEQHARLVARFKDK